VRAEGAGRAGRPDGAEKTVYAGSFQGGEHVIGLHSPAVYGGRGAQQTGEAAVAVHGKKIVVYALVVFALYVIITDPAKAADYVQIGFEGISSAAQAVGDFMTWLADGAKG
jgi:hypothetical protein